MYAESINFYGESREKSSARRKVSSPKDFMMISAFYLLNVAWSRSARRKSEARNYKNSFAFLKLTHKRKRMDARLRTWNFPLSDSKIASQLLSNKASRKRTAPNTFRPSSKTLPRGKKRTINEFNMRNFIIFMWWANTVKFIYYVNAAEICLLNS